MRATTYGFRLPFYGAERLNCAAPLPKRSDGALVTGVGTSELLGDRPGGHKRTRRSPGLAERTATPREAAGADATRSEPFRKAATDEQRPARSEAT